MGSPGSVQITWPCVGTADFLGRRSRQGLSGISTAPTLILMGD